MTTAPPTPSEHLDLTLTGMTCAACANRIEKKLNRLDGVTATVNYATEKAAVSFDPSVVRPDDLVAAVEAIGYGAALPAAEPTTAAATPDDPVARHAADLRQRFIVAAVLGFPVLLLSMIPPLQFRNWQWLAFALSAPVATWAAWPFHRAAWRNARQAEASMDTLVSVGVLAAFGWSAYALFFTAAGDNGMTMPMALVPRRGESHHLYLEVASATVALILLGRYFEARAKRRAGGALRSLLDLAASEATVLTADGHEIPRRVADLRVGDRFVVRPGERVATDGVVEDGHSAIDVSFLTGESMPVEVGAGAEVAGAAINTSGRLVVRATRVGNDTALAQMTRLLEQAQTGKAPVQRLADRLAGVFVPIVIVLAAATFGFWLAKTGSVSEAMTPAVAVLIIACPCALGLATPTALLVGTGRGAQMGILIKGPEVLESTRQVDTIVLDKTGTVTTGQMAVAALRPANGVDDAELLRYAAAVERGSEHPIARAICERAITSGPLPDPALGFRNDPGIGASGTVGGRVVRVGRPNGSGLHGVRAGVTVVEVTVDGRSAGFIEVSDAVKPSSAEAIAALRDLGLAPVLLTGDNETTAQAVAAAVGITDVIAGALPAEKVQTVARLQSEGRVVAMVGDGVNDAAALAQADLGIAMGAGTDVAIEASDLTLVRSDLRSAVDAIRLSRRTLAVIKGNLFWALAYNVAAIPLAMSWMLSPVVAGAAMAFSSVFVVSNSLRLRRFRASTN